MKMYNKTKLRREHYNKVDRILLRHVFLNLIIVFEIIDLAFIIFMIFSKSYFVMGLFILLLILFPYLIKVALKTKNYETVEKIFKYKHELVCEYVISEDNITFTLSIDGNKKEKKEIVYTYKTIKKIVVSDYIYVITNKLDINILDKNGFNNFDKLELRNIVQGKTKYVEE